MANILIHDEVQLLDWGETRSRGPYITLRLVDPALLECFRGMDTVTAKHTGHILTLTLSEGDILPDEDPKSVSLACRMHARGYFFQPGLREAMNRAKVYTEKAHKHWIQSLPCVLGNDPLIRFASDPEIDKLQKAPCEGDVIAHHVRNASNAGMGMKPPDWWTIPLCALTHHQNGVHSSTYVTRHVNSVLADSARLYLAAGLKLKMKQLMEIDSLSQVDETTLSAWEQSIDFKRAVHLES